ncbi:MAG: hypothetical protein JW902_19575 [Syntrophaceae bacterium]|nr:hypothetical protein [Syntrophaceae bacterium]
MNCNTNWQIDYQCPQCGAPVVLDEADRIMKCPYCRTKLYLSKEDGFQYIIPSCQQQDRQIYYVPYWRLQGSRFWFENLQVKSRFIDVSQKAVAIPLISPTLGIRPQAVKLKFAAPEMPGIFLTPQITIRNAFGLPDSQDNQDSLTDFIGEVLSLIYAPVYLNGKTLYDAVTEQRMKDLPDPSLLFDLKKTNPAVSAKILFLPTLCPHCGWNLEGEKDALTLSCDNCKTLWIYQKNRLVQLPFTALHSPEKPDIWLPFWKMKIQAEGFAVDSYADLIRLANLPKVANPSLESTPLYFWSPAFKINPALYMRWARIMTVAQPTITADDKTANGSLLTFHPVTLPLSEAVEGVRMNLGQLLSDKRRFLHALSKAKITLIDGELVYHPFRQRNSELIHTTLGMTVNRNALSLAVHLS